MGEVRGLDHSTRLSSLMQCLTKDSMAVQNNIVSYSEV